MIRRKYAFISYNHKDEKIAKWLQRKLESYKLPTEIHNEFENSRYLRPIFRDRSDLNTGILSEELREHLYSSKYLIVICSPNSAQSIWVSREVQSFIDWGRIEYIIPFIVDGAPYAGNEQECFPQALLDHTRLHPEEELLGIDIREDKRERAFIRLVSCMLGLSFDDLWHRHERDQRRRKMITGVLMCVIVGILYWFAVPISMQLTILDEEHYLPKADSYMISIGDREYQIYDVDTTLCIRDIPGHMRACSLPIRFSATYYEPISMDVKLNWGWKSKAFLLLKRDDSFAQFAGIVFDEQGAPLQDVTISVDEKVAHTDSSGYFKIALKTVEQREKKRISLAKTGYYDYIREDECPSENLQYILKIKN